MTLVRRIVRQPPEVGPIDIDDPDVEVAAAVTCEGDLAAVRRPSRIDIECAAMRQLSPIGPIRTHEVYVASPHVRDRLSVG